MIRFVARNYYKSERKNIRILDFGCGQGANTWYLAREGFDTYAFDGSNSAVIKCQDKLKSEGLVADLRTMDGTHINYDFDFFDAVIDNACIYSNKVDSINTMYTKVFDILKIGGLLLTVCFGEDLGGYRTGKEIEQGTYGDIKEGALANRGICHIFSEEELTELLKGIGFNIKECGWIRYADHGNMIHQIICIGEKPNHGHETMFDYSRSRCES